MDLFVIQRRWRSGYDGVLKRNLGSIPGWINWSKTNFFKTYHFYFIYLYVSQWRTFIWIKKQLRNVILNSFK